VTKNKSHVITDPFGDYRSLRRWSAAVLCAGLVPLSAVVAIGFGALDSSPGLLLVALALFVALAVLCAVWGDGMPTVAWEAVVVVLAVPFVLVAFASAGAGEALAPVLALTVGWAAVFLPRRALLVAVLANSVAAAAIPTAAGWNARPGAFFAVEALTFAVVAFTIHLLVASMRSARSQAEQRANTDILTGARSRSFTLSVFEGRMRAAEVRPFGLLLFDLDRFKDTNDTFGHMVGDGVLQAVADQVHDVIRDRDVVGRWGGEEFLVVVDGIEDDAALFAAAEKVRMAVQQVSLPVKGSAIRPTVSVGAMRLPRPGVSVGAALMAVDRALYAAKEGGRDRTCLAGAERAVIASSVPPADGRIVRSLPVDLAAPALARQAVQSLKEAVPNDLFERTVLVVSELVAHSVVHGAGGGQIDLSVQWRGDRMVIDVGKPAAASETAQALLAGTDGQALDIADQLSSTLELLVEDTTSIHCEISADDSAVRTK
jgi:diguanylate cyclase (GGDEF)-like protein